ncbi:MAG TPA: bifunctional DNA-formamidopyrimidine glycosylase/DNA-(apurinic or apyrimidinic site) lyase [Smithellaceae bacterium]|nr:bifunctional DNA-formamidopyrimidine glycosylase/DNA-(apurinic or apyrimidinic site) lyase [Smithellaceae bacterium]HRS89442.1 bifunctional DNA-formamidopyrimidine glycosylase/DNA-(apurinic or apyrimidinic site) lyase [Smithellaceae bacterium]HRV26392.1 bifunctional DNA-formamidopyrimidine glycosylase/DNA-(apurinic or apyrimidinic site) lyase [Smithellaceae bacterium]
MPELPEVETLCRQLQREISGKKIIKTRIFDKKLSPLGNLRGKTVMNVRRCGKIVNIELDGGYYLLIHLRMTGRLLDQTEPAVPRYARWQMSLEGKEVFLVDPRRFATVRVARKCPENTGAEIFGDFDLQELVQRHGRRKIKIKTLLMDQNAICGIGNIYACEILHRCGIHPEKEASRLTNAQWQEMIRQAKSVLKKAIARRGTSISDWRDLYGRKGDNQHELTVYGKAGSPCPFCGSPVRRIKQSGRGTYFCPTCQK